MATNMNLYFEALGDPRWLRGLPKGSHGFEMLRNAADDGLSIRCLCGFVHRFSSAWVVRSMVLGEARNEFMNGLAAVISGHVDEERWKLNPTLADLTDWGWFNP